MQLKRNLGGHYTNVKFTGWGSCNSYMQADFVIKANEAVSYGNTIAVPFENLSNPGYERYHITSATVHEAGHFLSFPHEQDCNDSPFYASHHSNQKFRFRNVDATWFKILPDHVDGNPLCLTAKTSNQITQEFCDNSLAQQF